MSSVSGWSEKWKSDTGSGGVLAKLNLSAKRPSATCHSTPLLAWRGHQWQRSELLWREWLFFSTKLSQHQRVAVCESRDYVTCEKVKEVYNLYKWKKCKGQPPSETCQQWLWIKLLMWMWSRILPRLAVTNSQKILMGVKWRMGDFLQYSPDLSLAN